MEGFGGKKKMLLKKMLLGNRILEPERFRDLSQLAAADDTALVISDKACRENQVSSARRRVGYHLRDDEPDSRLSIRQTGHIARGGDDQWDEQLRGASRRLHRVLDDGHPGQDPARLQDGCGGAVRRHEVD